MVSELIKANCVSERRSYEHHQLVPKLCLGTRQGPGNERFCGGDHRDVSKILRKALSTCRTTGERMWESEVLRELAIALRSHADATQNAMAESHLREAIQVARSQGAKLCPGFESRSTNTIAFPAIRWDTTKRLRIKCFAINLLQAGECFAIT